MFKLDLEKAEEPEIKLPTSIGSLKKQENSRKTSTSALLIRLQLLTVWITIKWKILQEMGIPDHLISLLRDLHTNQETAVRTKHGTMDWFKIGEEVCQGWILSPFYLTYMQSTYITWNAGRMKHKLESKLQWEISITVDMQMTPPLWKKVKRN